MGYVTKPMSEKIIVVGIDGMDPRLTRKFVDEGKMPNTKAFIERGAQRHDLVMLGGQPTVTPPMWTTLATGAYPVTHGITCFNRAVPGELDLKQYNFHSSYCKAEKLWNVFAEAGKKTLVWHWPGTSWPPTSDSPNLMVVDGTQPAAVNMTVGTVNEEFLLVADIKTEEVTFRKKAASDENVPCVVKDYGESIDLYWSEDISNRMQKTGATKIIILNPEDGEGSLSDTPFDVALSTITEPKNWENAPADAKEFTVLLSGGLVRRPSLILKGESGNYERVAIYKSKKEDKPLIVLEKDVFTTNYIDEVIKNDEKIMTNRNMRLLDLKEDGTHVRLWVSSAMNMAADDLWHPKSLFKSVTESVGYPQPTSIMGGGSKQFILKCMLAQWEKTGDWQAAALNHVIENEGVEVIFSHYHNIDLMSHMIIKYLKTGHKQLLPADYADMMEQVYIQTDKYIGEFLHLLDKDWTVFIVSDHAAVCPEHGPVMLGDMMGVNVRIMEELGFTYVKKDENGNDLKEIDWERTRAIAARGNHIYVNLKGRDAHGIVEPEDQYEVEEEIMTALYGYKDKRTGKRIVSMALRNRDAVLLGMGGPECGDIIYWMAEGYNFDHCDSLSTTYGYGGTSVSPIFIAAGKGLKSSYETDRIIREVDLAPTMAVLGGVRMPAQCEGAPVYQILAD